MKKLFIYLFVGFYFLVSIGVAANIHFCKNKVRSISLAGLHDVSCCGKKKMKKGCCENVKLIIKKQGSEKINPQDKFQLQFSFILPDIVIGIEDKKATIVNEKERLPLFHPPPESSYPSIYIKNCTFLI